MRIWPTSMITKTSGNSYSLSCLIAASISRLRTSVETVSGARLTTIPACEPGGNRRILPRPESPVSRTAEAESFTYGTPLTLTMPSNGSTFAGWGGGCASTGACGLVVTQAVTLTATFDRPPQFKAYLPLVTQGTAPAGFAPARRPGAWRALDPVFRGDGRPSIAGLALFYEGNPAYRPPGHVAALLSDITVLGT